MTIQTKTWFTLATALFLFQAVPGFAQQPPSQGGWRRIGEPPRQSANTPPPEAAPNAAPPEAAEPQQPNEAQQPPIEQQQQQYSTQQPPQYSVNPRITLAPGSWVTVRVNQPLSSDHNQPGDAFTATLAQPLVAEGLVIARRGQTVAGRVVDVQKGGHVKGTSSLSIELTELSLVDGQQVPIHTQLTDRKGGTSIGRDAGAIATTTGVGAAIGAAADGGFGAGMGAIAGAAVSTIGVLVTRGNATVVYPEQLLTFRVEQPVTIDTTRSALAFQPVSQEAYDSHANYSSRNAPPPPARYYSYAPYGYYAPYPYYGYYGFGPSFYFYSGPRFYRGYSYGHGYRRR